MQKYYNSHKVNYRVWTSGTAVTRSISHFVGIKKAFKGFLRSNCSFICKLLTTVQTQYQYERLMFVSFSSGFLIFYIAIIIEIHVLPDGSYNNLNQHVTESWSLKHSNIFNCCKWTVPKAVFYYSGFRRHFYPLTNFTEAKKLKYWLGATDKNFDSTLSSRISAKCFQTVSFTGETIDLRKLVSSTQIELKPQELWH